MRCLYYQWRISRAIDDGDESKMPAAHVERCPRCRSFRDGSLAITRRMRIVAAQAMPSEGAGAGRAVWRRAWAWRIAAVAAAAAAITIAVVFSHRPEAPRPGPIVSTQPAPLEAAPAVSLPSGREAVAAITDAARRPIERQLELASHDVRVTARTVMSLLSPPLPSRREPAPE